MYINGLNKISNERKFDELTKILKLENIYFLFSNKISREIILNIFPQLQYYERLKIINNLDKKIKNKYRDYLILALLIVDQSNNYEYFCHKYKTSNSIKNKFKNISINFENLKSKKFYLKDNIRKLIYKTNKDDVKDLLLFSKALNGKIKTVDIKQLIEFIDIYKVPKFPISGEYLKKYGYETGELLGKKLKNLETQWIENNFIIEKEILEETLNKNNKN